jgi:phosphate/phosphite/phosphonate ABC transporter binding protein
MAASGNVPCEGDYNEHREITSPRHRMKYILPILLLAALGCTAPGQDSPTQAPSPTATATTLPSPSPNMPTGPLGSEENPLVLALPPSTRPGQDVLDAGKSLIDILEKATGLKFVPVIPPSEAELVQALEAGNAHIAALSPFAYLLASKNGAAESAFAREQDGKIFYGAEFIARSDSTFVSHYDATGSQNLSAAATALVQFRDKKPCWTDEKSPSGYVVPLGILKGAGVTTREPAFLASHPAVVRAIYAGGICDFGATYVDARQYPGLEDQLPDVQKKVEIIWQIPPIIPYETLVFARSIPPEMSRTLIRAFVDLMTTEDGRTAMDTLYGFEAMQVAPDSLYADFRKAAEDSGLDLTSLLQ